MTFPTTTSLLLAAAFLAHSVSPSAAFQSSPHCQKWNARVAELPLAFTSAPNARTATRLHLFGALFDDKTKTNNDQHDDLLEKELARFSNLVDTSPSSPLSDNKNNVKFDSLSIMISKWSEFFDRDNNNNIDGKKKKMGLTTPVKAVPLTNQSSDISGVRLLFQKSKAKPSSAYRDKDDESKNENKDTTENEAIKEGGIEVQVQKLSNGGLQVVAKRCEIEEGTMIKEMSEQVILNSLRGAVDAWRKEQRN